MCVYINIYFSVLLHVSPKYLANRMHHYFHFWDENRKLDEVSSQRPIYLYLKINVQVKWGGIHETLWKTSQQWKILAIAIFPTKFLSVLTSVTILSDSNTQESKFLCFVFKSLLVKCQIQWLPEEGMWVAYLLLITSYPVEFSCLLTMEKSSREKQEMEKHVESITGCKLKNNIIWRVEIIKLIEKN